MIRHLCILADPCFLPEVPAKVSCIGRDDTVGMGLAMPRFRDRLRGRLAALVGAFLVCGLASAQTGDVNQDGVVDRTDRDAVVDHLLGITELTGTPLANADANQDGVVDVRDVVFLNRNEPDSDGDGLPDFVEPSLGLDPANADTDGNGVLDGDEDNDGDGLTNYEEDRAGLDPANTDTDGDGFSDGDEVNGGSNPVDVDSIPIFSAASPLVRFRFLSPTATELHTDGILSPTVRFRFLSATATRMDTGGILSPAVRFRYLAPSADIGFGGTVSDSIRYRYLAPPDGAVNNVQVISPTIMYRKQ